MAWILLLAGLAQPSWALAHALVHAHEARHHEGADAPATPVGASHHAAKSSHDDHAHLDHGALLKSRGADGGSAAPLPAAPRLPDVSTTRLAAGAREPPALAAPLSHALQPRAPPRL